MLYHMFYKANIIYYNWTYCLQGEWGSEQQRLCGAADGWSHQPDNQPVQADRVYDQSRNSLLCWSRFRFVKFIQI